jgi:hypothetical protein
MRTIKLGPGKDRTAEQNSLLSCVQRRNQVSPVAMSYSSHEGLLLLGALLWAFGLLLGFWLFALDFFAQNAFCFGGLFAFEYWEEALIWVFWCGKFLERTIIIEGKNC